MIKEAKSSARVLLLNPPTAAESTEPILGIAYLAAMLRKHGHEAMIVDATAPFNRKKPKDIECIIRDYRPHFIGLTLTIDYIDQTYEYVSDLRKLKIPIVAGGSHVNPLPAEALDHGVDIVALGEGENTIVDLANYFSGNGNRIDSIKGLCYKKENGEVFKTPVRPLISNLDDIPFPSFSDFPIRYYTGSDDPDSNPIFWSIFSSRGCPYQCTFCCGHNVFGRTYRVRSALNIFDEITFLVNTYGAKRFAFQDDEVMLHRERVIALCDMINESGLNIKISVRSRIDSLDAELLKTCKTAGFHRITFGIESWNDDTLGNIKKKYNVRDIKAGLEALSEAEYFNVNFNNIIGFPWETAKHYASNLMVIKEIPYNIGYYTGTNMPIPYPNTELYNAYHEKYGFTNWWLDPEKHWQHHKLFSLGNYRPLFFRFAPRVGPLFTQDLYWNYSRKQLKDIKAFCWETLGLFFARHMGYIKCKIVMLLCRLSHCLWHISPKLERAIFSVLPSKWIAEIEKQLSFSDA